MKNPFYKWFSLDKNPRMFGFTKLDLEIIYHYKKHGKFLQPEVLARCPVCNEDHRVFYFKCSCGDDFFCHLQNQEKNYDMYPTGIWTKGGILFGDK